MYLYTIYDRKAQTSGPIFAVANDAVGQRSYSNLLAQVPRDQLVDYQLLRLGVWDPEAVAIKLEDVPVDVTPERRHDDD